MNQRVRVRYAPSPTGLTHIGGLRTALYNELLARQQGGDFLIRVEDTDRVRYTEGATENLCRSFSALGVIPNEGVWLNEKGELYERGEYGPYFQSQRRDRHLEYAKRLVDLDRAYYCFCTAERLEKLREDQQRAGKPTVYDGMCRSVPLAEAKHRIERGESWVIRLKIPKQGTVGFQDIIRDLVTFSWEFVDDQVIIKSDGFPTYHLAATCDDHDMRITHVIRGEEWLSSTPKHLFIYQAFGWEPPRFAHLPLLLNPDRSKLSKRQGDVAVEDYLKKGYLPETLLNFVALLGWNPTADREVYTHEELVTLFDLAKINSAGAVFNVEKLDWLNGQYLRSIPEERYLMLTHPFVADRADDPAFIDRCLVLVRDRVVLPSDVKSLTENLFQPSLDYSKVSLTWKNQSSAEARERLQTIRILIASVSSEEIENSTYLESRIKQLITDNGWGNGDTLWPLRVALSGQEKSPGPFALASAYGKERTLQRLDAALAFLTE